MIKDRLTPTIEVLSDEVVLVQAWKKTSAYIRTHNWYSDTLAIDRASINLPEFISELSERIRNWRSFKNSPLRFVPAPKSQNWQMKSPGEWSPKDPAASWTKIRPLAHVDLADQVLATACMMCLADRVESAQGDPTLPLDLDIVQRVTSYGNRLFCDTKGDQLHHRWGSSKLYRSFYQDYQSFLDRPAALASQREHDGRDIYILQSDLQQFYDRVSTDLLHSSVRSLAGANYDPAFSQLFEQLMNWSWHDKDLANVRQYAQNANLEDFESIALPQGLVAAGFFANVVLLPFDNTLQATIGTEIIPNVELIDATRYVDDLRLVLKVAGKQDRLETELALFKWLSKQLKKSAQGLVLSKDKTSLSTFRGEERPLALQSRKMARIQTTISGGLDPIAGGEVLDAVLGLMRTQNRLTEEAENPNPFTPITDVRDATVNRFAAARFRTTYRSLRPLLWEESDPLDSYSDEDARTSQFRSTRTRSELDNEARTFALGLISKWVEDPSNVRLLRIGLDIWPSPDVLENVLDLLRPYTIKGSPRKAPRRVALFCLAELFRAGATETGFVADDECLPTGVDIKEYRRLLVEEAYRVVTKKDGTLPWYVLQQAFLMLATHPSNKLLAIEKSKSIPFKHYTSLLQYLAGVPTSLPANEFATNAVITRRAFVDSARATEHAIKELSPARMKRIALVDPSFAAEIIEKLPSAADMLTPRMTADLSLGALPEKSLAKLVLSEETKDDLRNEVAIVSFAIAFLNDVLIKDVQTPVTPRDVIVTTRASPAHSREVKSIKLSGSTDLAGTSLYAPPAWVPKSERWRYQLGFLIRFILTAQRDFTRLVRDARWKEHQPIYRNPESHWYQRTYGLYNGHSAFGDDWLPISEWTEAFLFGLLRWPGCPLPSDIEARVSSRERARQALEDRLAYLKGLQGKSALLIPLLLPNHTDSTTDRPLRACVIQTVYPGEDADFDENDLTFANSVSRTKHRRHLSAALASVRSALALRETHKGRDGRLDLLILPELSVHPDDVRTHLIPFARTFRTTIIAGLTFEKLGTNPLLINSALWIIPTYDPSRGWNTLVRRQGKANLAPSENSLNTPISKIRSFRPCQWLIGYPWSSHKSTDPLWMTSSICYDATDIQLAADLKNRSDMFIVPALNRDVNTYDQLAHSLHYNMFQMVVVANNGTYGGSNAYAPFSKPYSRQVFHLHGQPQASIAFFEIDSIRDFKNRKPNGGKQGAYEFKPPPAG